MAMAFTRLPMHTILAEQTERTREYSTTQIKQLIVESETQQAFLQEEINGLPVDAESQIAALVELRDRESAVGDALRSLVAPIHTLPVELLAEIFVLTIRESVLENPLHVRDAFRVSHICRRWRHIAHETPRLWTGPMHLNLRRRADPKKEEIHVHSLRAWFARSEPLSVSISIWVPPDDSWRLEFGGRSTQELLRIADRCRSLRFESDAPDSLVQLIGSCRLDFLEELELQDVLDDGPVFYPPTLPYFATAPRLRKFGIGRNHRTTQIPMPWTQLTDITLRDMISFEVFLEIFSRCTNVAKASFSTSGWSSLAPPGAVLLALDHLHILNIVWGEDEVKDQKHYLRLLDYLSAPALDELEMSFYVHEQWEEATFTAFQLRSPNIVKLKIRGALTIPSAALINALRHAPSLVYLSIDESFLRDSLLEALRYTENAEPLVPSLHSLTLGALDGKFSQDCLASMIASRWWTDAELASRARTPSVTRWRQIRVKDKTFGSFIPSPQFRDKMEALRQTGLAVELIESEYWDFAW